MKYSNDLKYWLKTQTLKSWNIHYFLFFLCVRSQALVFDALNGSLRHQEIVASWVNTVCCIHRLYALANS